MELLLDQRDVQKIGLGDIVEISTPGLNDPEYYLVCAMGGNYFLIGLSGVGSYFWGTCSSISELKDRIERDFTGFNVNIYSENEYKLRLVRKGN